MVSISLIKTIRLGLLLFVLNVASGRGHTADFVSFQHSDTIDLPDLFPNLTFLQTNFQQGDSSTILLNVNEIGGNSTEE